MHLDHKEWFIQAPWGRIAVIAWGNSTDEPVVYCHGKQDTAGGFHPLVQLLPRDKYYVGFDLPGNGYSDPFPPGLPISVFDFTFALKVLVDHFRWREFIYIGHSLGTQIGKYYNFAYPNQMTRIVDLDPIPAYYTVTMDQLPNWYYKFFFKYFDPENYAKLNSPQENAPTYTYDEAFELLKKNRNLTTETTKYVLDRNLAPAGDGRFRFSIDQRMKIVMRPPFTPEYTEKLYKSIKEPLLTVLAQGSVDMGIYPSYVLDKTRPNYFVEVVEGTHDVHIYNAKSVAPFINDFLAMNFDAVKAKL